MTKQPELNILDLLELCPADVAQNSARKVDKDGLSVAVWNLADGYYVTDDLCTHGPGSLSEGYIDGDTIECDFHNGVFSIKTGEVLAPPCMVALRTYEVHVVDGKVYIDPNQPALAAREAGVCPKRAATI